MPGQTAIHAGDKIRLEIGATSSIVQKDEDTDLTGNYIVTQLRHTFAQDERRHTMLMNVVKDSIPAEFNNVANSSEPVNAKSQIINY